jgi:hypothetical protein
LAFDALRKASLSYLYALSGLGRISPPLYSDKNYNELHRKGEAKPWTSRNSKWDDLKAKACKGKTGEEIPKPVADAIKKIEDQAEAYSKELPPPSWTEPGLQSPGDEFFVFTIIVGVWRGVGSLLAGAAAKAAASAAPATGKVVVPVAKTIGQIIGKAA